MFVALQRSAGADLMLVRQFIKQFIGQSLFMFSCALEAVELFSVDVFASPMVDDLTCLRLPFSVDVFASPKHALLG